MSAMAQQQGYAQQHQQQQPQPGDQQQEAQSDFFSSGNNRSGNNQLENMGYDQNNPNMSNMGWEGDQQGGMQSAAPMTPAHSMGAPTPYRSEVDEDEDYQNPASVPGMTSKEEEMKEDETVEEYEDRVLNKRAAHLNTILRYELRGTNYVY